MLAIADLSVSFAGVRALSAVGLEAAPGKILGLIGPNGSGKSTLLNVVAGLILPEAGSVRLDGEELPLGKPDAIAKRGVARTFQMPRLARRLTVAQNMIAGRRGQPGERLLRVLFAPRAVRAAERETTADEIVTVATCWTVPSNSAPISGPTQVVVPPIIGMAIELTA